MTMTLDEYLTKKNLSNAAFHPMLQAELDEPVSVDTIRKHRRGLRQPRPKLIRAYFKATGGKVTANDFAGG